MGEYLITEVIIKFNEIESNIKSIISNYLKSEKPYFVDNYLLNNLVIDFTKKYNILRFIAFENNFKINSEVHKAIKIISTIRNAVAHSDKLSNFSIIGAELDSDEFQFPIFGLDPDIITIDNDQLIEEKLKDKVIIFRKYYEIVKLGLIEFENQLSLSN